MLDVAHEALAFARGRSRSDLDTDRQLLLAIVKAVEHIGYTATTVSECVRLKLHDIPWEQIVGMSRRLVHANFDINSDVVWNTLQTELPDLVALLEGSSSSDHD